VPADIGKEKLPDGSMVMLKTWKVSLPAEMAAGSPPVALAGYASITALGKDYKVESQSLRARIQRALGDQPEAEAWMQVADGVLVGYNLANPDTEPPAAAIAALSGVTKPATSHVFIWSAHTGVRLTAFN
jgi:hypothetical protein